MVKPRIRYGIPFNYSKGYWCIGNGCIGLGHTAVAAYEAWFRMAKFYNKL